MSKVLEYSVVDVFAERELEGNPLAVFHDGRGLSGEEMQALARETNLSETTFVLPGDPEVERVEGVRVRIFTSEEELPFAGHPTLGTASWLYWNHPTLKGAETVTLGLGVGPIPVRFDAGVEGEVGVRGTMLQNDPVFGEEHDRGEVARLIGMEEGDLLEGYRPKTVSTGNAFCVVALRSVEVLGRLQIPQREAKAWLKAKGVRWFYCIAPIDPTGRIGDDSGDDRGATWRARMQWSAGEDPATGSGAGPCVAWLVRTGLAGAGERVVIEQGVEMKRPSRITASAELRDGRVCEIRVSGRTIRVAEGRFFLS